MLILEFNNNDKNYVIQHNDIFTISLEIELETRNSINKKVDNDKVIDIIRNNVYSFINDKYNNDSGLIDFCDSILNEIEPDSLDYSNDILDDFSDEAIDKSEHDIIAVIQSDLVLYTRDDLELMIQKVKDNLPNFFNTWWELLKFELDSTLENGIEFSFKEYVNNINDIIKFIDDFYQDFNNQDFWEMNERTGIHINIGIKNNVDWNILKGLLMISDSTPESFTFKNMEWRKDSKYTKSFLPQLIKDIKKKNILKKLSMVDIENIENVFNDLVPTLMKDIYKNYGFNIMNINKYNYVEFRYAGGQLDAETLKDKIYYFCYIVLLMSDNNYKRKEYIKKLYKFITNL